jgi:uncharacterized repeat protein (TIGR03803 family)
MCSAKTSLSLPREFGVLGFNRKAILPETLRLSLTIVITAVALLAGLLLVSTQPALAQTETVLYSFANNGTDGYQPYAALTKGKSGTLYGTTDLGGTHGYGTVFELTKNKCETPLLNFNAGKKGGGEYPYFAGLVIDKAGNLYGTTSFGGAHNFGAVFVLTPSGAETVLYSFGSQTNDGAYPFGGVVLDKSGNLYGTTTIGGVHNKGTVFKVSPAGAETVLYSFAGGTDGCNPDAGVVLGKKNVLYGTTIACGSSNNGIVFTVTQAGVEAVMHTFNLDGTDGILPYAGIVLDKAGDLYGTTYQGGANDAGTVYKLTPTGTETILHSFSFLGTDGYYPQATVVFDKEGNIYGTTTYGADSLGTVFEITPGGTETVLHSFQSDGKDGYHPYGGVILVGKVLYGTTLYGGSNNVGTVFKVVPYSIVLSIFVRDLGSGYGRLHSFARIICSACLREVSVSFAPDNMRATSSVRSSPAIWRTVVLARPAASRFSIT